MKYSISMSRSPRHRRPLIEALEPRLLFSATADIAVFDDGASDGQYLAQAAAQTDLVSIYMPSDPVMLESQAPDGDPQADLALSENPSITTLVFVDTTVDNYETLVDDIRARVDANSVAIVYLDASKDGVEQISDYLAGASGISAIHIISHGVAGNLQLGNQVLNENNINQFKEQLTGWQTALGADADILLYGCDLAANQSGVNFLGELSELTGADVAASNDLTGNSRADADWVLEERIGLVETESLFAANEPMLWQGALADVTYINTGAPANPDANSVAITTTLYPGQTFQYFGSNITVDRIALYMKIATGAQNQTITLELHSDSWNGTQVASYSIGSSSLPNADNWNWVNFNFNQVTLDQNKSYWIKITSSGTDGLVRAAYHPSSVYNNGTYVENGSSNGARDLAFQVVDHENTPPQGADTTIGTQEDTSIALTAANFGFSDAVDNHNFAGVVISSLPGAGTLTLTGSGAVSASQFITIADINAGKLVFTPAANANGANYAQIGFQVRDDSSTQNTDLTPNTLTINVTAVNDAPINTVPGPITVTEDITQAITGLSISDVDAAGLNMTVTLSVTNGVLTVSGGTAIIAGSGTNTVTLNGTVAEVNATLAATVNYTPGSNYFGADTLTINTSDNGNTGTGNVLTDQDTVAITVTSVNDTPTGADKTVTTNEDTGYTFAVSDFGFSDVDSGESLSGVRIDSLPISGSLTLGGVAVTAGQVITSANIANLVFTPATNANGASYANFTFSVRDQSSSFDTASNTITIDVTSVNDAPSGSNTTLSLMEDGNHVFTSANFGFSDTSDSPANSLMAVTITTLPAAGSLTLNGVAVTLGQSISLANISAGNLVYTPAANANGTGYSSFTFQVQDNGGTANGGVNLDPSPNTITLDVTAVNDAPAGSDTTLTIAEDGSHVFNAANFGFSDSSDSPANSLSAVTISTLPGVGSLTLNGVAVTLGQSISLANISAGNLVYTPAANANGTGYSSFTFQVQDNGGTANGGVNIDSTPNTITLDVTPVNDAPINSVPGVQITTQDTNIIFSAGNGNRIQIADVDAGSNNLEFTLSVTNGSLTLAGVVGLGFTTGDGTSDSTMVFTGTLADINTALATLTYSPTPGYTGGDALVITTRDLGSSGAGGAQQDGDTINITVTNVNDPPAINISLGFYNAIEQQALNLAGSGISVSDPDGNPLTLTLAATAAASQLHVVLGTTGVAISSGDGTNTLVLTGTIAQLNDLLAGGSGGGLTYLYSGDSPAASETLTITVYDGQFTANDTAIINITAVNDAPDGTDATITLLEDGAHTLTAGNFGFSDIEDSPANALSAVRIASLPAAGSLTLNAVDVNIGDLISIADINSGLLVYTPATHGNGAGYASFTFQVQDDGGTTNGGVALDPVVNSLTFDVTSVNDAPSGSDTTLSLTEDGSHTFSATNFGFSDTNDSPANSLMAVTITTLPGAGNLTLSGVAVTLGQSISLANISAGNLVFTPAANANGTGYSSFTFQVQDSGGTANGGVNIDPSPNTITIDVTSVNDAPSGSNTTLSLMEDGNHVFTSANFGFSDTSDSLANSLMAVTITTLPAAGSLTLNGVAVTLGQSISLANISAGNLVYTPAANANGTGYSSFTFQVQDNGGTANGGVNLDPSPNTITLDVTAVNDAPAGSDTTLTIAEDGSHVFNAANFGFSDSSDSPANSLSAVTISTLPGVGSLTLNGVAVTLGQSISLANISAGNLVYTPAANANGTGYSSFTFQVQDNGGTANGGVNIDSTPNTITLDVTAVNDAPLVLNSIPDRSATEGALFNFQFAANTFADADLDTLTYSAQFAGGALPAWLSFDPLTRTFSGTPANGDIGTVSIDVIANDGNGGTVTDTFDIVVSDVNDPPTVANAIPDQNATEDAVFNFQFAVNTFADVDVGNTLTYSAQLAGGGAMPAWLSFDPATRTFSGTPLNANVGTVSIDVIANDGNGGTVTDTFSIVVANVNDAPTVANPIPNQSVTENSGFNFTFALNTFNDQDVGDVVTYTAQLAGGGALPAWLSFNAATRTFSGVPTNANIGTLALEVIASDGNGGSVADSFDLVVSAEPANLPPVVQAGVGDQVVAEDSRFAFTIPATAFNDPEGDALTYSVQLAGGGALPSWLTFDAATRTFSGTPQNDDVGVIDVVVTASDGSGSARDTFTITVTNTNDAPEASPDIYDGSAQEDSPFTLSLPGSTFSDEDVGDELSYSARLANGDALPSWLHFDAETLTLSGTPGGGDVGMLAIQVIASDGQASAFASVNLTIVAVNDVPVTSGLALINNLEDAPGNRVDLFAAFSDDETPSNQLLYSVVSNTNPGLVSSAVIDPVTGQLQLSYGANQFGSADLVIRAQDAGGAIVETSLRVNIESVNDVPTTSGIADVKVDAGTAPQQMNLRTTFSDIEDGAQLKYSVMGNSNPAIATNVQIDPATGMMVVSFSSNVGGESVITLRALDADGAWVDTQFKVTVTALDPGIEEPVSPQEPGKVPPTLPPTTPPTEPPAVEVPATPPTGDGDVSPPLNPGGDTSTLAPGTGGADSPGAITGEDERIDIGYVNDKSSRDYARAEELLNTNSVPLTVLTASTSLLSLIAPDAGFAPWEAADFDNEVRRLRAQMDDALEEEQDRKAVVAGLTFSVTTGLLVWSLRASSLLLTMMSMLPLWRGLDPLPILDEVNKKKKELEQQRKDREREDKSAKEVGYLFDHAQKKGPRS